MWASDSYLDESSFCGRRIKSLRGPARPTRLALQTAHHDAISLKSGINAGRGQNNEIQERFLRILFGCVRDVSRHGRNWPLSWTILFASGQRSFVTAPAGSHANAARQSCSVNEISSASCTLDPISLKSGINALRVLVTGGGLMRSSRHQLLGGAWQMIDIWGYFCGACYQFASDTAEH